MTEETSDQSKRPPLFSRADLKDQAGVFLFVVVILAVSGLFTALHLYVDFVRELLPTMVERSDSFGFVVLLCVLSGIFMYQLTTRILNAPGSKAKSFAVWMVVLVIWLGLILGAHYTLDRFLPLYSNMISLTLFVTLLGFAGWKYLTVKILKRGADQ